MNVLVTGGTGYIGRVLVPQLLKSGYDVTVLDRGFLDYSSLKNDFGDKVQILREDVRTFDPDLLRGFEAVIDLAALSNDPAGNLNVMATWDINYLGRVRVARIAKKLGTKKYIVASSCSVYGFRNDVCDEKTQVNPLTPYAEANIAVENDNLALSDKTFSSTALRFATVFGYSERFRLDLVINAMTFYGYKNSVIKMMRDGNQYRPFIHVKDAARALISVIESENEEISGKYINIGSNSNNVQISKVAEMIRKKIGNDCKIELYGDTDNRSYQVNFNLSRKLLSFDTKYDIESGVNEIIEKCKEGLNDIPQMHTVDYYKKLLQYEEEMKRFTTLKPKVIL
jgi:nucleoside-diphosphate-sugar epimerase